MSQEFNEKNPVNLPESGSEPEAYQPELPLAFPPETPGEKFYPEEKPEETDPEAEFHPQPSPEDIFPPQASGSETSEYSGLPPLSPENRKFYAQAADFAGELLQGMEQALSTGDIPGFERLDRLAGELENRVLENEIQHLEESLSREEQLSCEMAEMARQYGEDFPRLLPLALEMLSSPRASSAPLALALELAAHRSRPEPPLYLEGSSNFKTQPLSPDEEWFLKVQSSGGGGRILS